MRVEAVGYAFRDEELLRRALGRAAGMGEYQRLEFLGDRVLGLVIGGWLFEKFPGADEGELSRRLTFLVRESTLVQVAAMWELEGYVKLGMGEVVTPGILADTVEAVLGAVWLDGGIDGVQRVVHHSWEHLIGLKDEKDAKTRLQEWLQGKGLGLPVYEVTDEGGLDHDKWFRVRVTCAEGEAEGEGRSKQVAGLEAAIKLMEKIDG